MIPVYLQPTNVSMQGHELIDKGIKCEGGKAIDPSKTYVVPSHKQKNHYREMKRLFKKDGMSAVNKYLKDMLEVNTRAIVATDTITNGLHDRQQAITSGF